MNYCYYFLIITIISYNVFLTSISKLLFIKSLDCLLPLMDLNSLHLNFGLFIAPPFHRVAVFGFVTVYILGIFLYCSFSHYEYAKKNLNLNLK